MLTVRDLAPAWRCFGRCPTAPDGSYAVLTLKPGPVPGSDGSPQAPHIDVSVFARGLLKHLVTRLYFPDEQDANATDPVLTSLRGDADRATLVATASDDGYVFDIRLQGDGETVFFDV